MTQNIQKAPPAPRGFHSRPSDARRPSKKQQSPTQKSSDRKLSGDSSLADAPSPVISRKQQAEYEVQHEIEHQPSYSPSHHAGSTGTHNHSSVTQQESPDLYGRVTNGVVSQRSMSVSSGVSYIDSPLTTGLSIRSGRIVSEDDLQTFDFTYEGGGFSTPTSPASQILSPKPDLSPEGQAEMDVAQEIESINQDMQRARTTIWFNKSITNVILAFYEGYGSDHIATLTKLTCQAQSHGSPTLAGRAQLWKGIILHEMGETDHMPELLADATILFDDGAAVPADFYQYRKMFSVYGPAIWRWQRSQELHGQGHDNDTVNLYLLSPEAVQEMEEWHRHCKLKLEQSYDHNKWPDPDEAMEAGPAQAIPLAPSADAISSQTWTRANRQLETLKRENEQLKFDNMRYKAERALWDNDGSLCTSREQSEVYNDEEDYLSPSRLPSRRSTSAHLSTSRSNRINSTPLPTKFTSINGASVPVSLSDSAPVASSIANWRVQSTLSNQSPNRLQWRTPHTSNLWQDTAADKQSSVTNSSGLVYSGHPLSRTWRQSHTISDHRSDYRRNYRNKGLRSSTSSAAQQSRERRQFGSKKRIQPPSRMNSQLALAPVEIAKGPDNGSRQSKPDVNHSSDRQRDRKLSDMTRLSKLFESLIPAAVLKEDGYLDRDHSDDSDLISPRTVAKAHKPQHFEHSSALPSPLHMQAHSWKLPKSVHKTFDNSENGESGINLTDTPSPTKLLSMFPDLHEHQESRRRSWSVDVPDSPSSTSYEHERRQSSDRYLARLSSDLISESQSEVLSLSQVRPSDRPNPEDLPNTNNQDAFTKSTLIAGAFSSDETRSYTVPLPRDEDEPTNSSVTDVLSEARTNGSSMQRLGDTNQRYNFLTRYSNELNDNARKGALFMPSSKSPPSSALSMTDVTADSSQPTHAKEFINDMSSTKSRTVSTKLTSANVPSNFSEDDSQSPVLPLVRTNRASLIYPSEAMATAVIVPNAPTVQSPLNDVRKYLVSKRLPVVPKIITSPNQIETMQAARRGSQPSISSPLRRSFSMNGTAEADRSSSTISSCRRSSDISHSDMQSTTATSEHQSGWTVSEAFGTNLSMREGQNELQEGEQNTNSESQSPAPSYHRSQQNRYDLDDEYPSPDSPQSSTEVFPGSHTNTERQYTSAAIPRPHPFHKRDPDKGVKQCQSSRPLIVHTESTISSPPSNSQIQSWPRKMNTEFPIALEDDDDDDRKRIGSVSTDSVSIRASGTTRNIEDHFEQQNLRTLRSQRGGDGFKSRLKNPDDDEA